MRAEQSDELLIVFAREPVLGKVKTRLAAQSSDEFALAVYQRLLTRTLRLGARTMRSRSSGVRAQLMIAGDWAGRADAPTLSLFSRAAGAFLWQQPNADLGARMHAAFLAGFEREARRIVLMGCDCPSLSHSTINAAFDELEHADLVIAPTEDGGYGLIGLTAPAPGLFDSMQWSVADVYQQTLTRAGSLKRVDLPVQADIDHLPDWQRWCADRAARGLPEGISPYKAGI